MYFYVYFEIISDSIIFILFLGLSFNNYYKNGLT